jgi:ubiquinone/menaquinone biosynthesis C-methylase UbiE
MIEINYLASSKKQIGRWQAKVDFNHCSVETFIMRAQELAVSDNHFDFSFTNFVVSELNDPEIVARHLYRVLKVTGQTTVCTLAFHPHDKAINAAHLAAKGQITKSELDIIQSS